MKCLLSFSCDTLRVLWETLGHYLRDVKVKLPQALPKSDSPWPYATHTAFYSHNNAHGLRCHLAHKSHRRELLITWP